MWYGKHIEDSPFIVSKLTHNQNLIWLHTNRMQKTDQRLSKCSKFTVEFHKFQVEGDGPEPAVEELVKKVKVSGVGLVNARVQEYNEVLIDCRRVYLKDHKLRCSVKSPSKSSAMVKLQDNQDGTYSMFYKPMFPGAHTVNVRVDDIHVNGSPFAALVRN